MIGIKYIGKRERHVDNLYGTGLEFSPDQVHNVDDAIAPKFLQHTDTYEGVKATKGEDAVSAKPVEADVKHAIPLPNLEGMGKNELISFAQQHYGEQLHHRMTEQNMRSAIHTLIQARGR